MVIVGTSGYYYRGWRGAFYPEDLPTYRWLEFYSNHFNGLELNSSFYRPPTENSIKKLAQYPLYYSLKLFRGITHEGILEKELLVPFFRAKELLGERLITFLAQFPYSFKPKGGLEFLLKLFNTFSKKGITITVELRNPSWKEKLKELEGRGVPVACIKFPKNLNWLTRCIKTKGISYFRLHGKGKLYGGSYSDEELRELANDVKSSTSEIKLIFFNNTSGGAVKNAKRLMEILLNQRN